MKNSSETQSGFPATMGNFSTSGAGFHQTTSTSDPSALFDALRDGIILQVAAQVPVVEEIEGPIVTHKKFFGENVQRVLHALKKND